MGPVSVSNGPVFPGRKSCQRHLEAPSVRGGPGRLASICGFPGRARGTRIRQHLVGIERL
jgi:hypothetical protein